MKRMGHLVKRFREKLALISIGEHYTDIRCCCKRGKEQPKLQFDWEIRKWVCPDCHRIWTVAEPKYH